MNLKEPKKLSISQRIIQQMAKGTIRSFIDAIVELVTNADDSYKRLKEKNGEIGDGEIQVIVKRTKGGGCEEFILKDLAEGMSEEQLEKALIFGEAVSGFEAGKTVRGFMGRGLKESIISLGQGEILSIKDNKFVGAKVWWDTNENSAKYQIIMGTEKEGRGKSGIQKGNGTAIAIDIFNEKIKCPEYKTLKYQIENHYSLRDINTSKNRVVELFYTGFKSDHIEGILEYTPPTGKVVFEKSLRMPGYGDELFIRIYESEHPLGSCRMDPFSQSGLLIKTEGAIIDKQLFRFENDKASEYFYGEVICKGMAERIRKGESLIDNNRAGIEWRHQYCQTIQMEVEKSLAPLIEKKKEELERNPPKEISSETKKMLDKVCQILNKLANMELKETDITGDGAGDAPDTINELLIKPETVYLMLDVPRYLSVYAPEGIINFSNLTAEIRSDNENIAVLDEKIGLNPHNERPELYYGKFRIVGKKEGEQSYIYCKYGDNEAIAQAIVLKPKEGKKKRQLTGRKGGLFSSIVTDEDENPGQRVSYSRDNGEIRIFIKFPSVNRYLGLGLKGADTHKGRVMLAELVGEAFCRELAIKNIDFGKYPLFPGNEIGTFNSALNDLQKKYLAQIHEAIVKE